MYFLDRSVLAPVFVHVLKEDSVPLRQFVCAVGAPCCAVALFECACAFTACLFLSVPFSRRVRFSHREGTVVADHYKERDCGRSEFSRICLRLRPLLNEQCSILLIMLLWLMSLSADSQECNKTFILFGLFAFLIGLNKRVFFYSCPAIDILRSGRHLFFRSFYICTCKCRPALLTLCDCSFPLLFSWPASTMSFL